MAEKGSEFLTSVASESAPHCQGAREKIATKNQPRTNEPGPVL